MVRTQWQHAWFLAVVVTMAGGLMACDQSQKSPSAAAAGDAQTGKLVVALSASSATGTVYRLDGATFLITGNSTSFSALLTGSSSPLERDLPPGSYNIQLLSGYTLDQVAADGTVTAVPSTLVSQSSLPFGIRSQHVTAVSFQFQVGDAVVTTGDGTVSVGITVDDGLIDDFEDGDGFIANLAGRQGAWFTFNDGTGIQTPAPGSAISPDVDPYSTNYYLHTTGSGFATSNGSGDVYGAGVGANLSSPAGGTPGPYDASGYGGITFSYRLSTAPYSAQLRLNVATSATTPVAFGGTCTQGCSDDFGYSVSSASYYCYYYPGYPYPFPGYFCTVTVPFSQLTQVGFGTPATFDPKTIIAVKWGISWPFYTYPPTPNSFDFSLDDVAFVSPAAAAAAGLSGGGQGGFPGGTGGAIGVGGVSGGFGGAAGTSGAGQTGGRGVPGTGGAVGFPGTGGAVVLPGVGGAGVKGGQGGSRGTAGAPSIGEGGAAVP